MSTEERLAKLGRELKELKALISTKALFRAKDLETSVESQNLDVPTFKRRKVGVRHGSQLPRQ